MVPAASILLCTVPRSGSWLLAEGLETTGLLGRPREYFRPDYEPLYRQAWGVAPDSDFRDYLDNVIAAGTTPNGVFGVKLHWGQFVHLIGALERIAPGADRDPAAAIATTFPEPTYVFLHRANQAEQAVSLYRAMLHDIWWRLDEAPRPEPDLLGHDPDFERIAALQASLAAGDMGWRAFFDRSGIDPIRVRYEDLSDNYRATLGEVLSALPIKEARLAAVAPARLRKQADQVSDSWLRRYRSWRARREPAPAAALQA